MRRLGRLVRLLDILFFRLVIITLRGLLRVCFFRFFLHLLIRVPIFFFLHLFLLFFVLLDLHLVDLLGFISLLSFGCFVNLGLLGSRLAFFFCFWLLI